MKRIAFFAALAIIAVPSAGATAGGLTWTQLPGVASSVAVATDGSIFALATTPAGLDKNILHYVAGHWTTVSGLTAESIAVGPAGILYAAKSSTGVFAYDGATWKSLGGAGLDGLTTGADGSIYALGALADKSGDRVVWRKLGANAWTRQRRAACCLRDRSTWPVTRSRAWDS